MAADEVLLRAAQAGDEGAFARLVEPYRRELKAHCYRMAGSLHEADDLLQESLLRVWRGLGTFAGRASLRTWIYTVATRACLDALESRGARRLPWGEGQPVDGKAGFGGPVLDPVWLEPCPESLYDGEPHSPEARLSGRQSVALALLVAIQSLPARQRAVLLLRDVLGWEASECAEILGTSVASVTSALQRARETLRERGGDEPLPIDDEATSALLSRYLQAWERADVPLLVSLLRDDATLCMPPLAEWLRGPAAIGASIAAMVLTPEAAGQFRLRPVRANGLPAMAAWKRDDEGVWRASAIHLLEVRGGALVAIAAFIDPSLFPLFDLPLVLD